MSAWHASRKHTGLIGLRRDQVAMRSGCDQPAQQVHVVRAIAAQSIALLDMLKPLGAEGGAQVRREDQLLEAALPLIDIRCVKAVDSIHHGFSVRAYR